MTLAISSLVSIAGGTHLPQPVMAAYLAMIIFILHGHCGETISENDKTQTQTAYYAEILLSTFIAREKSVRKQ